MTGDASAALPFDDDPSWKRRAGLFLASQNLSLFGSGVVGYAILWHITLETSSGLWMMLYTVCALVPTALISPWGGVFADRHSRKALVMLSDGFIALATLGLAIAFILVVRHLEMLLAVSVVRSIGAGFQTPAVNALFPQLVPAGELTRVQGINQSVNSVLLLLSPAIGGVVLGTLGIVWTFFIDVVTAALAIAVMAGLRVREWERQNTGTTVTADLREGLDYVLGHVVLRRLMIFFGFSFFLFTPAMALTPLLIERDFGGEVWRLTANEVVWSAGSLIGGIVVSWWGNFRDKIRVLAGCMVLYGISFAFVGMVDRFWLYLLLMGIGGLFLPAMVTAHTVLVQETAATDKMGRVFSLAQIVSHLAMPAAILLFGPLADVVSVRFILIASGAMLAVAGAVYGKVGYGPK